MDRYFYTALLLTGISSFGCLTVAIAKEQVSMEYSNSNVNDLNSDLYSIDRHLGISLTSSIFQNDIHQELQTITKKPLVTAVLEGKLGEVEPLETKAASKPVVSNKTLEIVKEFEGFRSSAYLDTDGTPVIGYGQSRINGRKVRLGDRVSPAVADASLKKDLQVIQTEILSTVKVDLNEHQLGAITSLAFNTGIHAITRSTLVRKLNQQNYLNAANEFPRWNKANVRGRLVRMEGLSRRRNREKQLFLTPVVSSVAINDSQSKNQDIF